MYITFALGCFAFELDTLVIHNIAFFIPPMSNSNVKTIYDFTI